MKKLLKTALALIVVLILLGSSPIPVQADSGLNVDYVGWYLAVNGVDVDKVALSFDVNLAGKYEIVVELMDNDKRVVSTGNRIVTNLDKKDKVIIDLSDAPVALVYYIGVTVKKLPTAPGEDGPSIYYLKTDLFGLVKNYRISYSGEMQKAIEATSEDGMLTISIPKSTIVLDKDGKRLKTLKVAVDESPPLPPEDAHIIGLAYNFGPSRATFDPALTLTWRYDPEVLPERVEEENLVLAYYDQEAGRWVEIKCLVDTVNNIITASINHFTTFAIIGYEVVSPPVIPPPEPEPTPPEKPEPVTPEPVEPTPTPVEPTPVSPEVEPEPVTPVTPEKPNWPLIIGVIIAGVLISSGIHYYYFRKRRAH